MLFSLTWGATLASPIEGEELKVGGREVREAVVLSEAPDNDSQSMVDELRGTNE